MSRLGSCFLVLVVGLAMPALPAGALETSLPLLQCDDEARGEDGGTCVSEDAFYAGTSSAASGLQIGGDSWHCGSEWATSLEFDLGGIPAGLQVFSARLVVRKTGYSDDSQGFFYCGVFPYAATGGVVPVPRDDLTPDTTLDVVYPPAANVDLSFDVTGAVAQWVADGESRAGLLLAGIYSEAGYEDWISIGGATSLFPPRLIVDHEGTVAATSTPWSLVKARYR
jgi:hypothetical protein